uniref:Uncharacterized protein n=1 Tax=Anguilla anguilla TaxID=7936 RepID=A0A0E9TGN2_ANGAN
MSIAVHLSSYNCQCSYRITQNMSAKYLSRSHNEIYSNTQAT